MTLWFRPRIRHPFFPGLKPTAVREAKGRVPALCGAFAELTKAARRGVSVRYAVFVLLTCDEPPLDEARRDLLWNLFQTPAYAILLDPEGGVAAFECEAQNGFHLPAFDDAITCECGRPGRVVAGSRGMALTGAGRLTAATAEGGV